MMARERSVIIDDDDPPPKRSAEPRHTSSRFGFEWGLASTIIGATLLVLSPLALRLIGENRWGSDMYSRRGDTIRDILLYGGVAGAEVMSIIGVFFGITSVRHARSDESPAALGLTGILLCIAAILIWLALAALVLGKQPDF
jgi:hypothetical protein